MRKLMAIAAVLVFMAGSAYAADWNFYGSARVSTFYTNFDSDPFSSSLAAMGLGVGSDTSNFEEGLYGNSRIGAKVHVSDTLSGRFEYGALGGSANVRLLYGEWDFGAGKLLVGQNYTPLLFPYSNQVYEIHALGKGDHDMSTFGMLYGSRKAQVRLTFGNFQIAAVEPKVLVNLPASLTAIGTQQPDQEIKLPSIQAKYKFEFPAGHVSLAAGYQNWDVISGSQTYDVTSWILGIGGRVNVGPAYFKANVWGGQNVGNQADILVNGSLWSTTGNAGTGTFDGDGFGLAQWDGTQIIDRDAIAALLVAGFEIRKGLYMEAGYGYVSTELDAAGYDRDEAHTYYLQATVFLAPGVFLTPEIGRCDMEETNQPVVTYFGVKWQINF